MSQPTPDYAYLSDNAPKSDICSVSDVEAIWIVGLGSNLGSRRALLRAAIEVLARQPGVRLLGRSRLYFTPPFGPPQPHYLNAAVALRSDLSPLTLLDHLLAIEASFGRIRRERFGPRTLDLDLLTGPGVAHPRLEVPHPRLRDRPFALAPLLDLSPLDPSLAQGSERWRELEGRLSALGGSPRTLPWEQGPPLDRADALAESLSTEGPIIGDPVAIAARGESFEAALALFRARLRRVGPGLLSLSVVRERELRGQLLPTGAVA